MRRLLSQSLLLSLASLMLLISPPKPVAAQINMQQMPGYSSGFPSSAATNRNRTDSPVIVPTTELRVVPAGFANLLLAPGFLVNLNVLDDPDFVGTYRIDEQGNMIVPILGPFHVAGKTASEARDQIKQRLLDEKILNDPKVTLSIVEYTAPEVTILGEVTSPGKYPLLTPRKLVEVLALAGGPTLLAGNHVQITSATKGAQPELVHYSRATNLETVEDVLVHPGDSVQVERAGIVYVLGAVNRPGGYVMQEEGTLNVLQAISLANGTSMMASIGTIYLLRRNADGSEVDIAISYKKITQGKRSDIQLRATDVLFVPTSTMKSIWTNSQGILTSAAGASIYAAAIY